MTDKQPFRKGSAASSSGIHAPRPRRPVNTRALTQLTQTIEIPPEVLNQAEEVTTTPELNANHQIAQVEVENGDGTIDQVFMVVVQQPRPTQKPSQAASPGTAAYYDDCVSDYSHQSQHSSTPPQQTAGNTEYDPAGTRMALARTGVRTRNAMGPAPKAPFASDKSVIMMTTLWGDWFKVLKVYAIPAVRKCRDTDIRGNYANLRQKQSDIVGRVVAFGRDSLDAALSEAEKIRKSSSSRQPDQQALRSAIRVIPTHNEINPEIPTLTREHMLAMDLKRRAAAGRPDFRPVTQVKRKSIDMQYQGPLANVGKPWDCKSLPAVPKDGSLRRLTPATMARQPKSSPMTRGEMKPVINSGFDIQSQRGSLAAVSVADSSTTQSTERSSGRSTFQQSSMPALSSRASSTIAWSAQTDKSDPHAARKVPWAK